VAVRLEWLMNNRVAYTVFSGLPDMGLIHAAERDLIQGMDASSLPVHAVLDIRELIRFPPLIECIRSPYVKHERRGWIIIIGLSEKPLFRVLANSLINGLRLSARSVDSLDEALAVLRSVDPSLGES
jgi:hypothetical protein